MYVYIYSAGASCMEHVPTFIHGPNVGNISIYVYTRLIYVTFPMLPGGLKPYPKKIRVLKTKQPQSTTETAAR